MWMVQDNFTFAPKVRNANHMRKIEEIRHPGRFRKWEGGECTTFSYLKLYK